MQPQYRVSIIGGGSWGTALAIAANRAGSRVTLATRNARVAESIREERINEIYLPDVFIDPAIAVTNDFREACRCDFLVVAVPSHCVRSACISISDFVAPEVPIVIGSKGVERGSLLLMSEVVQSVLPNNRIAVISGPGFAQEVARGLPTATTLACASKDTAELLAYALGSRLFRPYLTDDAVGAQIGGTVKNVIAIACGIVAGKELGENAGAALIARGFAEMARLAAAKGARMETLTGLSGLGDLVLTCGSRTSRNMSLGIALSRGENARDVLLGEGRGVLEGAVSAESVVKLARKHGVEMPVCEQVFRVLSGAASVEHAIAALLDRPFAEE